MGEWANRKTLLLYASDPPDGYYIRYEYQSILAKEQSFLFILSNNV